MDKQSVYTVALVLLSLLILSVSYGYLDPDKISPSAFGIGISSGAVKNSSFYTIVFFAFLIALLYAHFRVHSNKFYTDFTYGYRYAEKVVEEVSKNIAAEVGSNMHGAPVGNIRPKFFERTTSYGQFTKSNGQLTGRINITLSMEAHLFGIINGLKKAVLNNLLLVLPGLLGLWSLCSVIS